MRNDTAAYYNRQVESGLFRFILEYPNSFGAMFELNNIAPFLPADTVKKYYARLSDELQGSTLGRKMRYTYFEYPELIQTGRQLPDFSMPDSSMQIRQISEFRGKYLLLDFWASWCGPCLEELPKVKRLDSLYGEKGLQVIGISMDASRLAWTQSIIKNNIKWINLSDLKGEDNEAAYLLNIISIPAKFLIDPEGKILLVEASLPEIENILSEKLPR